MDRTIELSGREREVAEYVRVGYSDKEIARIMDISIWTVRTYLRFACSKMGASNRTDLAVRLTS